MFSPTISANRRRRILPRDERRFEKAAAKRLASPEAHAGGYRMAYGCQGAASGYPSAVGRAEAVSAAVSGPLSGQTLIPWRASNAARIGAAGWAGRQMKKLIGTPALRATRSR
jgi:hypothetical protein